MSWLEQADQPGGADRKAGDRHQDEGAHDDEKDRVLHCFSFEAGRWLEGDLAAADNSDNHSADDLFVTDPSAGGPHHRHRPIRHLKSRIS